MSLQGSDNTYSKGALARTLRYFGQSGAWSTGLFIFFVLLVAIISFLTDAVRLEKFDPLWLAVSGAAILPSLVLGICYKFLVLRKDPHKSRPWLNLLVAGIAGSFRNISVGIFALWTGLDTTELWAFRTVGGFIFGIAVFAMWSSGLGSRIEYDSALKQLSSAQSQLSRTRLRMPEHLADVNDSLQDRTRASLRPQFELLKELLGGTGTVNQAVDELRNTLTNQIRPMMDQIAKDQPSPIQLADFQELKHQPIQLPERFTLRDKIKVGWSSILVWFGIALWMIFLGAAEGFVIGLQNTAVYALTLGFIKLLLPAKRQFQRRTGLILTFVAALIACSAAVTFLSFQDFQLTEFLMMAGFIYLGGVVGPVMLLQVNSRVEQRHETEKALRISLHDLAKENALFAQRVWVFRKRWLLVLHGTVQSALTAAIARLQTGDGIDDVKRQLVLQDLRRAEAAMEQQLHLPGQLTNELGELTQVWQGICDVKISISERARRAMDRQYDAFFCVNEIAKEAISNAVRHGSASEAKVTVDRIRDDLLAVEVSNNGAKPNFKQDYGIGSEMLDEICLNWELTVEKNRVVLRAELPVNLSY